MHKIVNKGKQPETAKSGEAQFQTASPPLQRALQTKEHRDAFESPELPRLLPVKMDSASGGSQSSNAVLRRASVPRPGLVEAFEARADISPLEGLLVENEALGAEAHVEPKIAARLDEIGKLATKAIKGEKEILAKLETSKKETEGRIREQRDQLGAVSKRLEEKAAGLPAAQSEYGESLRELAQFYAVRGWSDEQKKKEVEYLQPKIARLSAKLQTAEALDDWAETMRIEKKKTSLEGLLLAALAGPSANHKFNDALRPLFAVARDPEEDEMHRSVALTDITLMMLAKEPESMVDEGSVDEDMRSSVSLGNDLSMSFVFVDQHQISVNEALYMLAKHASELFGAESEKASDFAKRLEDSLLFDPKSKTVKNSKLLEKLEKRKTMVDEFLESAFKLPQQEKEKLAVERQIYQREADLIGRSLETLKTVVNLAGGVEQRDYVERDKLQSEIRQNEREHQTVQNEILAHQKSLRLREYQSLSKALGAITQEIRNSDQLQRRAGLEGHARKAELKTTLKNLDSAFAAIMHRLETLDSQNWIEAGQDPYPTNWGIQEKFRTTGDERPTPSELMREYHLAKIGATSVSTAYMDTLKRLAQSGMTADSLMENLKPYVLDPITLKKRAIQGIGDIEHVHLPVIGPIKNFAMNHPVLARDLAANLMHTFSILSSDASWLSSAKAVLQRKTYEDWVSDATMGGKEHLYTTEVGHSLSPEVIAFLDLAEKAPYIANGIKGAAGGSAAGNLAQRIASWIPGGSHPFFQGIAGALGGISEVKAHKLAAAKMARNQEVAANMIWAAMRATNEGKGLKGALSDAFSYGLARQALQLAGGTFRAIHEEGVAGVVQRNWNRFKERWMVSPGKEVAKTIGASAAGMVTSGAAVIGSGLLGTFALGGAAPAAIVVGGGVALGLGALAAFRLVRDNFFVSDEQRKRENLERLKGWTAKLPKAIQPKIADGAARDEHEKAVKDIVTRAIQRLPDEVYQEALNQKGGEKRADGSVLTDQDAQEKYILAKVENQVLTLDRMRQLRLAEEARSLAAENEVEIEEDELVMRLRRLNPSVPAYGAIKNDARREQILQEDIKTGLSEIQDALPASKLERDPAEEDLYGKIEALKGRAVTPADLEDLRVEAETLRIRQMEGTALQEEDLRALWDPNSEIDQELEARLIGLQLPDVPRRSVDVRREYTDEEMRRGIDALRATSSTKKPRRAVALEENK